jgi:hypothetical protein
MKRINPTLFIGAAAAFCAALLSGCATSQDPTAETTATPPPAAVATASATTSASASNPAGIKLSLVKADSEEKDGEDGAAANAVDGNKDTFWHTQWQDANPPCPHEIIIELKPAGTIKGFTYLPRQDDGINGTIKDYEFYAADTLDDFGQPAAKGAFENNKDLKTVTFEPRHCRYIKLKALSEINDQPWTSAAEIGVVQ